MSTSAASRSRPSCESSRLSARASRSVGIMPVRPAGNGYSSDPRFTKLPAFSGLRPTSSAASPSSSHNPIPRGLRERKLSAPPSTTKPSTCSVSSFPPSRSAPSTRTISASGRTDSSSRAAASPAIPPPTTTIFTPARPRTSSASASMNTGSSFRAGGRSSRIPSSSATARALTSTSNRSSTWSETKPTGTTTTLETPRASSSRRCSPRSGPAQGSGVRPAD